VPSKITHPLNIIDFTAVASVFTDKVVAAVVARPSVAVAAVGR